MPRPSSDAQRLAARYNIEIVGGESAEELTRGLVELLGKVETIAPDPSKVREDYLLPARAVNPIRSNGTDSNPSLPKASLEDRLETMATRLQVGESDGEKLQLPGREETFRESLSEAIDEGLMSLGPAAGATIYFQLEKQFSLERSEIPQRVGDFELAIQRMLSSGGTLIEKMILEQLCKKLGVAFESLKCEEFQAAVAEIESISQHKTPATSEVPSPELKHSAELVKQPEVVVPEESLSRLRKKIVTLLEEEQQPVKGDIIEGHLQEERVHIVR